MDKFKIPDNLINDIYSNNTARIKTEGRRSGSIPVNLRQGDSLSPLLFSIVMDEIFGEIKNLKGYSLGDENLTCVCYADDAALVAEDEIPSNASCINLAVLHINSVSPCQPRRPKHSQSLNHHSDVNSNNTIRLSNR